MNERIRMYLKTIWICATVFGLGVILLFIGVFVSGAFPCVIIAVIMLGLSFIAFWPLLILYLLLKDKVYSREGDVLWFNAKPGKVYINTSTKIISYDHVEIKLCDIISYELRDMSQTILKSGLGEAAVGGLLFGGMGALAGAYAGKRIKHKEKCKLYIKCNDVLNAGVVIALSLDNGYRLYETIELLMKDLKQEQICKFKLKCEKRNTEIRYFFFIVKICARLRCRVYYRNVQ